MKPLSRPYTRQFGQGFIKRLAGPAVNCSVEMCDSHLPSSCTSIPKNAGHSGFVVFTYAHVFMVFNVRHITKILKSIIGPVVIYMINIHRIFAGLHFPNYPMDHVRTTENLCSNVAINTSVSYRLPSEAAIETLHDPLVSAKLYSSFFMGKNAGIRVVAEKLAQNLGVGQFDRSHSELILRCGQGLALLTQRLRPAFYTGLFLENQAGKAV